MRVRFNDTPELGMKPIEETPVLEKSGDAMHSVIRALIASIVMKITGIKY